SRSSRAPRECAANASASPASAGRFARSAQKRRRRTPEPYRWKERRCRGFCPGSLLDRLQIGDDVCDSDVDELVRRLERSERRAPHGHRARAVRRYLGAVGHEPTDAIGGEDATVPGRDPREIGRRCLEGGGYRAATLAVPAVARRTVPKKV